MLLLFFDVSVMGGALRARVEPEMRYWDWAFGIMVSVPMVSGTAAGAPPAPVVEGRREVLGP